MIGERVIGSVGGDFTVRSPQDTDTYKRNDQSAGVDAAVGMGGGSVSVNCAQSKIDSDYTSVRQQSGIQAGSGGFQIDVKGHTQLDGGAIASTATPDKNYFSTGSLGYTDLKNEAEYKATSVSVSVSGGCNGGSGSGGYANTGDKATSVTKAGIADGTLIVKDGSGAGIARGTTELQQDGLKEIYDARKVDEQMEMGQVAAEVGFTAAGDIARSMTRDYERAQMAKEAAESALLKETDPNRASALNQTIAQADRTMSANQAQYDLWKDGGTAKAITHAVAGAMSAGLGGGSSLDGALGAAAAELARPLTADETKLVKDLVSFGIGAAVGGSSGASTGLAGEVYNRELHESEKTAIERVIAGGGDREAVQAVACALVKCWSGVVGGGVMTQVLQEQTAATISSLSPAEYQKIVAQLQSAAPGNFQYFSGDRLDDWAIDNDLNGKLKWLGNTIADLTPGIGDVKGFAEADSPSDYMWASVGLIPVGGDIAKGMAKGAKETAQDVARAAEKGAARDIDDLSLLDKKAETHVLEGEVRPDGTYSGGHRPGTGFPGKSEFPADWTDQRIKNAISEVATDPSAVRVKQGGRTVVSGTRDGVEIRVIVDNKSGRIVTGYPTNTPRNP